MDAKLIYVHDPMCSWCWAFSRTYDAIIEELPEQIKIERLLGGLAPDTDELMSDEMRDYVRNHWRTIQARVPGVEFNFDFWTKCKPRRATYPACRAVIAARNQGKENDRRMTRTIQEGYYLRARNPSESDTLIEFAGELGLDRDRFARDLASRETHETLLQEIRLSRELGVNGFPSLLLALNGSVLPVTLDYASPGESLQAIKNSLVLADMYEKPNESLKQT